MLWKRELARKGEKGKVRLLDADERRVLVALRDEENDGLTTFGLDAAKGERLWQVKDEWVYELAGDTALGLRAPGVDWEPHEEGHTEQGRLFGVDTTSGTERWAHKDEHYGNPTIRAAVPGRAALNVKVKTDPRRSSHEDTVGVVIDTDTGREVHRDKTGYYPCAADTGLLACATSDDELMTVRAGKNTKPATAERSPAKELDPVAVHQDRIYLSGKRGDGDEEQYRHAAVDRAGNPVLDEADGTLLAASEAQVAIRTSPDTGRSTSRAKQPANPVVVRPVAVGDRQPKEPQQPPKPKQVDLGLDKKPLWSLDLRGWAHAPTQDGEPVLLSSVDRVWLHEDTVVLSGEEVRNEGGWEPPRLSFLGLDARSGKVRWRVDAKEGLPDGLRPRDNGSAQLIDEQGGLLLLDYQGEEPDSREGVAAVAVKDGSVRWTTGLKGDMDVRLVGADGDRFAVSRSRWEKGRGTVAIAAEVYELDSRRQLMSAPGHTAVGLSGDTLVTHQVKLSGESGRSGTITDVVGFAAASGSSRWKLADRYRLAQTERVVDGAVVTNHRTGAALIEPKSGKELAALNVEVEGCVGDGEPLVACGSAGEQYNAYPVSIELRDGKATVRQLLRHPSDFATQHPGREPRVSGRILFTPAKADPAVKQLRFHALDARGRRIADELRGQPLAVNEDHVLLLQQAPDHDSRRPSHTIHLYKRG